MNLMVSIAEENAWLGPEPVSPHGVILTFVKTRADLGWVYTKRQALGAS